MKKFAIAILVLLAVILAAGESYRIILLGDLHFDSAEKGYHRNWKGGRPSQPKAFERNAKMWKERMPALLGAAAKLETPDTLMVIQLGDLIHGACNDPDIHRQYILDALEVLGKNFSKPVLIVTGNHDVDGRGAAAVWHEVVGKHNSDILGQEVKSGNVPFTRGGDSYTVADLNAPDAEVMRSAPDGRYRFILSHGPAIADDTHNSRWMLFGKQGDELRREMLDFYFKNNVVIFTGHTHHFVRHRLEKEGKVIDQVIISSVWTTPKLKNFNVKFDKVSDYGKVIDAAVVNTEKEKASKLDQQNLHADYAPLLTEYIMASSAGFATVDVSDEGITFTLYGGDDHQTPLKKIKLR